MAITLKGFDPIIFLGIDTASFSPLEISELRNSLMSKIGQYILLKLSSDLSKEQFNRVVNAADGETIMHLLKPYIPNLDKKILNEVENFKKEFQNV